MKNSVVLILALSTVIALMGCGAGIVKTDLQDIPEGYTLEQAEADGCVVYENSGTVYGQEIWDGFLHSVDAGKAAQVRLCFWSDNAPGLSAAAYPDGPEVCVMDLEYDGEFYAVSVFKDGEKLESSYQYLFRFDGGRYTRYILTNDSHTQWKDEWSAPVSSETGEIVDYELVYISENAK